MQVSITSRVREGSDRTRVNHRLKAIRPFKFRRIIPGRNHHFPAVRAWQRVAGSASWRGEKVRRKTAVRICIRLRDVGTAVNPFRYFADPLCVLSGGLYLLNRVLLRPHLGGPFLRGHFNDLLVIPAAVPLVLWLHARLGWRDSDTAPTAGEIFVHVAVWSFVCEVIGPHLNHRAVGDPVDVVCYAGGGALAWLWWHRSRWQPLPIGL